MELTDAQVQKQIIEDLDRGNFVFGQGHAPQRMNERRIMRNDIQTAARNYTDCYKQKNGRWRVIGPDADREEITIIVKFNNGTTVVTVY
jgi:hypothetical protein